MSSTFPTVQSIPYPWPYDNDWSPRDTAILAIDYQRDLCSSDGFLVSRGYSPVNLTKAIEHATRVLSWARKIDLPVVHTRHVYHSTLVNLPPTRAIWSKHRGLPVGEVGPCGRFLVAGEPGSEIIEPLSAIADEPLIDRSAINPFLNGDLHSVLLKMGVRNLIILGGQLEGSVHTAVCAANDRGYEVALIADACPTLNAESAETVETTTILGGGLFGTISTTEALIATSMLS